MKLLIIHDCRKVTTDNTTENISSQIPMITVFMLQAQIHLKKELMTFKYQITNTNSNNVE